jgi:hypothetical protein
MDRRDRIDGCRVGDGKLSSVRLRSRSRPASPGWQPVVVLAAATHGHRRISFAVAAIHLCSMLPVVALGATGRFDGQPATP